MADILSVVGVLSCLVLLAEGGSVFESRHSYYTEFPEDEIPQNVSSIFISHSRITHVDYVPPYPNLISFSLAHSRLEAFPNLTNVCARLLNLQLPGNQITTIDRDLLNCMVNLKHLDLSSNRISSFPEVQQGPRDTLNFLALNFNSFTEFPAIQYLGANINILFLALNPIQVINPEDLQGLEGLNTLMLAGASIRTMPDLCSMTSLKTVFIVGNSLNCDVQLSWMKLAEAGGRMTVMKDSRPCGNPESLEGMNWSDISLDDLKLADVTAMEASTPNEINPERFICAMPPVTAVLHTEGLAQCHVTCMQTEGCVMFGFLSGQGGGSPAQCAVTMGTSTSENEFDTEGFSWFTIY